MVETGLIIDTLEDVRELVKSGMPEPQAETVVRQRVRLLEGNLATKADIEKLRLETKADIIEKLRLETKAGIEKLRLETKAGIEKLSQETKAEIAATNANVEKLSQETKAGIEAGDREADSSRQDRHHQVGRRRQSGNCRYSRGCGQTPLITASSVSPALAGHPGGRHGRAECRVTKTKLVGKASEDDASGVGAGSAAWTHRGWSAQRRVSAMLMLHGGRDDAGDEPSRK